MKRKSYIKRAIVAFIEQNSVLFSDFTNWYVGVTAKPDKRYSEHGSPNIWREWEADHPDHARDIEKYFLELGLKGGSGGGTRTRYIYIYKHSGPNS